MEFDVTLTEKDMVHFNLYHTYSRFSSWFAVAVAVVAIVVAVVTYGTVSGTLTVLYILVALLILVYMPINTVLSAKRRTKLVPDLLAPLHYSIDKEGIKVSKGEEEGVLTWDKVFRVISFRDAVYIYSSRIYAYVIPKTALGDKETAFYEIARAHLEPRRLKGI